VFSSNLRTERNVFKLNIRYAVLDCTVRSYVLHRSLSRFGKVILTLLVKKHDVML
jgi:hypothetical protein